MVRIETELFKNKQTNKHKTTTTTTTTNKQSGTDAPHVYVRAWKLCCLHRLVSRHTESAGGGDGGGSGGGGGNSFGGQLLRDKEKPSSGVTNSGRIWRNVHESEAGSVRGTETPSSGLRHPSSNHRHN